MVVVTRVFAQTVVVVVRAKIYMVTKHWYEKNIYIIIKSTFYLLVYMYQDS